jgi:hypothetical protein
MPKAIHEIRIAKYQFTVYTNSGRQGHELWARIDKFKNLVIARAHLLNFILFYANSV